MNLPICPKGSIPLYFVTHADILAQNPGFASLFSVYAQNAACGSAGKGNRQCHEGRKLQSKAIFCHTCDQEQKKGIHCPRSHPPQDPFFPHACRPVKARRRSRKPCADHRNQRQTFLRQVCICKHNAKSNKNNAGDRQSYRHPPQKTNRPAAIHPVSFFSIG